MCMKIMRPTNVRASVGSRASGSSARPIVSVPPFLTAGGFAEVATVTATSASAPITRTRSALRARAAVILFLPLLGNRAPPRHGVARLSKWIQLAIDWIQDVLSSPRYAAYRGGCSAGRPPGRDDPGASPLGRVRVGLEAAAGDARDRVRGLSDA